MELPSTREIDLEILVRERDKQLVVLTDEVRRLRSYISSVKDNVPSTSEPFPFSASTMAILSPYINSALLGPNSAGAAHVNADMLQRYKTMERENNELYEHLKSSETGRLLEENKALHNIVDRLTSALKEAHETLIERSAEVDHHWQNYFDRIAERERESQASDDFGNGSITMGSPEILSTSLSRGGTSHSNKELPTSPRSHKKPRLSQTEQHQISPVGNFGGPVPPRGPRNAVPQTKHGLPSRPRYSPTDNIGSRDGTQSRQQPHHRGQVGSSSLPSGAQSTSLQLSISKRDTSPHGSSRALSPEDRRKPSGSASHRSTRVEASQDIRPHSPPRSHHSDRTRDEPMDEKPERPRKDKASSRHRSRDSTRMDVDEDSRPQTSSRNSDDRKRSGRESPSHVHAKERGRHHSVESRRRRDDDDETSYRSERGESHKRHRDDHRTHTDNGHQNGTSKSHRSDGARLSDSYKRDHDDGRSESSHKRSRDEGRSDGSHKRARDDDRSESRHTRDRDGHTDRESTRTSRDEDQDDSDVKRKSDGLRVKGAHREPRDRTSSHGHSKSESREHHGESLSSKSLLDRIG